MKMKTNETMGFGGKEYVNQDSKVNELG